MKIIQVCPYYPPHLGGMEVVSENISKGLLQKSYEVEVVTSSIGQGKILKKGEVKKKILKSFEILHTPITPTLFFKLLKITKKDDILHLHLSTAFFPEITCLVAKLKKAKLVVHNHNGSGPSSNKTKFLLELYNKFILKWVFKNADLIITQNVDYKQMLSDEYNLNTKKIKPIPNGVSEIYFNNIQKKIHQPTKYLFVGRICKQKNLSRLIEAVSLTKNKEFILTIVGEGEEEIKIKKLVRKLRIDNIIFLGKKNQSELVDIYNNHDILILSSDYEGFGLVLLEAMAGGLPIISTNFVGVKELIAEEGLLSELNPEDLAKKIDILTNNSVLFEEMSEKCKIKAKKYTWDICCDKITDEYKKLK